MILSHHQNIQINYVLQTPNQVSSNSNLVVCFHGSFDLPSTKIEEIIQKEFEQGRWKFSPEINASTIFLAPIIERSNDALSNGLEVDPQRLSVGCVHPLCKVEQPEYYSPHLQIKKLIDEVRQKYGITKKITLIGISAGGAFATRFAFLYPDLVGSAISFLNEQLVIPKKSLEGLNLPFPFGLEGTEAIEPEVTKESIQKYLSIPKLVLIDRDDYRDSLPYDIDQAFYEKYTNIFGVELHERASNLIKYLKEIHHDNIELVITEGNGHRVDDEEFDEIVERYLRKIN